MARAARGGGREDGLCAGRDGADVGGSGRDERAAPSGAAGGGAGGGAAAAGQRVLMDSELIPEAVARGPFDKDRAAGSYEGKLACCVLRKSQRPRRREICRRIAAQIAAAATSSSSAGRSEERRVGK